MEIWDNERKLRSAVSKATSRTQVLELIGYNPRASISRRKLNNAIERFNISTNHFLYDQKFEWDYKTVSSIVRKSKSYSDVLRTIGLATRSGNFNTLKRYITKYDIDISHFDPIEAGQKRKNGTSFQPTSLKEILEGKHPSYRTYNLKHRLFAEGIKREQCELCNIIEWQGKPITFDLDHINGVRDDHRLTNLRVLCPNCHSQTPTYKNKKR